jgi:hypothetical protein
MATALLPQLADGVLDDRVLAVELAFIAESLENPPGRMTLLAVNLLVAFEDLPNNRQNSINLTWLPRSRSLIAWRLWMRKDLLQCVPVDLVQPANASLALLVDQYATADIRPHLHILIHPSPRCY